LKQTGKRELKQAKKNRKKTREEGTFEIPVKKPARGLGARNDSQAHRINVCQPGQQAWLNSHTGKKKQGGPDLENFQKRRRGP